MISTNTLKTVIILSIGIVIGLIAGSAPLQEHLTKAQTIELIAERYIETLGYPETPGQMATYKYIIHEVIND